MSAGSINFSGLGSGIDTESIIQKFLQIDQLPEQVYKTQQQQLLQRQTAYNTVSAQLLGFQSAASALNRLRAFDVVTASSSDDTAVSVSATAGAQTGTHSVQVTNLAKAQLLSSAAQTSQTAPLGFSGQILINGTTITVQANDSLQTLAANINSAQIGVNASIISPSANQFYLTLGSANTGLQGQISLSDTGGGTLLSSTLGLFDAGGTTTLRNPLGATGAGSALFKDSATSIGTLEGQTAPVSGNVTIGGTTVSIDLATDSLSAVAGKINTAGIAGVSASVISVTDPLSGDSRQQLQISGTQSFTDNNNVLANLGIVQRDLAVGRELTAAHDAVFSLDGLPANRPTNSFTDAISGLTITLNKEGGAKADLTVNPDLDNIKSNVSAFVKGFNDTVNTVLSQSQFDPDTGKTGVLFGDGNVQSVLDGLTAAITDVVPGLPSNMSLLSQAGITLGQNGLLTVDDATLTKALTTNRQGVARLFRADGVASDSAVQFISSTTDTQASGTSGYAVVVTQAATQATLTAATAQTQPLAQDEVVTFGGPLFGTASTGTLTGGHQITLRQGSSLADIVSQINGDSTLSKALSASISNGRLQIVTKQYGSNSEFAVLSGVADSGNGDTSGLGNTLLVQKGKDVAGTINGEAATGVGQLLTGSKAAFGLSPKGRALGLQLRVTATAAGNYGSVVFTSGLANVTNTFINTQTDPFSGNLTEAAKSVQDNIDDLQKNIDDMEARLKATEDSLRAQFNAMETAITRIKASSAGLSQLATISK